MFARHFAALNREVQRADIDEHNLLVVQRLGRSSSELPRPSRE